MKLGVNDVKQQWHPKLGDLSKIEENFLSELRRLAPHHTMGQLVELLGVADHRIRHLCTKHSIDYRRQRASKLDKWIQRFNNEMRTTREWSQITGVDRGYLTSFFKQQGIAYIREDSRRHESS